MKFYLSPASLANLHGVHPDLVKVVERAIQITKVDFKVIDGLRTLEDQKRYFETGKSATMHSRHLTGHAVDVCAIVNGRAAWEPRYYMEINDAMQQAADEFSIPIRWGGKWTKPADYGHFELPIKTYPD